MSVSLLVKREAAAQNFFSCYDRSFVSHNARLLGISFQYRLSGCSMSMVGVIEILLNAREVFL